MMETETRYKKWMEKVTQNAVDNALQFRKISQRTNGFQISSATSGSSSTLSRSMSVSGSSLSRRKTGLSKNWRLDVHSTERKSMAASIYALLLQWNPDCSGQWASRVAAVVPVFEEALYQSMANLKDYKNTTLLDLHLRQILRQFESGNGPLFFNHQASERCLTKGRAEEQARVEVAKAKSVRTHNLAKSITDDISKLKTAPPSYPAIKSERNLQNDIGIGVVKENCHPGSEGLQLTEGEADITLWDAFLTGDLRKIDESFCKYEKCGNKNSEMVAGLISMKEQGELRITKEALQNTCADKINMRPSDYREASEPKCPQHVSSDGNVNAQECSSRRDGSSASVDGAAGSPRRLFAEEGSFMLKVYPQTLPAATFSTMPFNQTNSDNWNAEVEASLQVVENPDWPQAQVSLKSGTVSLDALNSHSTLVVLPASNEERKVSAVLRHDPVKTPGMSTESAPYEFNRIQELEVSEHHHPVTPLHKLFQLDDDRAVVAVGQPSLLVRAVDESVADIPACSRISVESSNAESSQYPNGEQAGEAIQTESSITEASALRLRAQSFRVSLLSLLRERDQTDGRVSLMSLLREREDYEVVIFDQDMLASITKDNLCLEDDDCEPSEMHKVCCVCMVGQRGAAFVPCGHTFCRNCASELQMSRGACPLCNRGIKQILKLY